MKEAMAGNRLEASATVYPEEESALRHRDATGQGLQPAGTLGTSSRPQRVRKPPERYTVPMGSTRTSRFSPPLAINLNLDLSSNREQQGGAQEGPPACSQPVEERDGSLVGDEEGQPIPSNKASDQQCFVVVPTALVPEAAGALKVKSSPEQRINVQPDDPAPPRLAGRKKSTQRSKTSYKYSSVSGGSSSGSVSSGISLSNSQSPR